MDLASDNARPLQGVMMSADPEDLRVQARLAGVIEGNEADALALFPLPDSAHVFTLSYGGTTGAIWSISKKQPLGYLDLGPIGTFCGLAFELGGRWMVVGTQQNGVHCLPIPSSPELGRSICHIPVSGTGEISDVALTGSSMYVSRHDGSIQEWVGLPEAPRLEATWSPPMPAGQKHVISFTRIEAVEVTGRRLACQLPYAIQLKSPHSLTILKRIDSAAVFETERVITGSERLSVSWSSDGSWLAIASVREPVQVINMSTNEEYALYPPNGMAAEVAFSPDGRFLAIGGANSEIEIRSTGNWSLHTRFVSHPNGWDWRGGPPSFALAALEWTPDSRYLLTEGGSGSTYDITSGHNSGPADFSIKVWEIIRRQSHVRLRESQSTNS